MKGIAVCADMWLFLFQSTHLDTQSLDSTQEACDSPLCKGSFRACKNDWSMLSKHSIYIHASLGLKKQFQLREAAVDDAQTHPPLLNSHTDTAGSFASASWEIFPSAVFFLSLSLSLSLTLHPTISVTSLTLWFMNPNWRQADFFFELYNKSDSE